MRAIVRPGHLALSDYKGFGSDVQHGVCLIYSRRYVWISADWKGRTWSHFITLPSVLQS
jgi:hypothetical protein